MGKKSVKGNWRGADVQDVEKALAEQSSTQAQQSVVDDSLFFIDSGRSAPVQKKEKKLWVQKYVEPQTKLAPLISQKRCTIIVHFDPHTSVAAEHAAADEHKVDKIVKRIKAGEDVTREKPAPVPVRERRAPERSLVLDGLEVGDIWNVEEKRLADFIPEPIYKHRVRRRTGQGIIKTIPAVEPVAPGSSYNPSYEDHQDVIGEAVAVEIKDIERRKKLKRKMTLADGLDLGKIKDGRFGMLPADAGTDLFGASHTHPVTDNESSSDSEHDANSDDSSDSGADGPSMKTKNERKRERAAKQRRKVHMERVEKSKLDKQIKRIPDLLNEIEKEEKVSAIRQALKKRMDEEKASLPNKTGKHRFMREKPEVVLTEELPGSLREMKTVGNLAMDRFKSFQKRNMIEIGPRKRSKRVKAKYADGGSVINLTIFDLDDSPECTKTWRTVTKYNIPFSESHFLFSSSRVEVPLSLPIMSEFNYNYVPHVIDGLEETMPDVVAKLLQRTPAHGPQDSFFPVKMLNTPQLLPSPSNQSVPSSSLPFFSLDSIDNGSVFGETSDHYVHSHNAPASFFDDFHAYTIKSEPEFSSHSLMGDDYFIKTENPESPECIVPTESDDGMELARQETAARRWKKKERDALDAAVRLQVQHILLQRSIASGLGNQSAQKPEDIDIDEIEGCLDAVDWELICQHFISSHTAEECRLQWHALAAMPSVRTPSSPLSDVGAGKGKWTKEEDWRLVEAIREFGDSHWKLVANYVGTRSAAQCLHRWKHSLKPSISRSKWTTQEDERLMQAVKKHGRHWSLIAHVMGNRTGAQCRERYCNKLDPEIYRGQWTADEDRKLREAVDTIGSGKWAQIAKVLNPPRTDYQIRKRWYIISRNDPVGSRAQDCVSM